ncbi:MAG TPA: thermonuclease family protein [Ruminiclostridium sp.]|nr:thermonuclease family protein [Ruminiclostridium sp.]
MKKKSIALAAALITAAVMAVQGYLYQGGKHADMNGGSDLPAIIRSADPIMFPKALINVKEEGIEPFGYINAVVTKVTDGDTFHADYKNKDYKVRMLDIDTPESVKAGVAPQPFSKEASDLTKQTLTGQTVKLIFEEGTRDQYGRLLAHVVLKDGRFFNAIMVRQGYAVSLFYSPNTLLKSYYDKLQKEAIKNSNGFWRLPQSKQPFVKNSKGKYVAVYRKKNK